ncbi:hypothetical protein [Jidongwangia harbinensis]|uniref:hypothetical protein n=1 Tax=Jidongwangia harbinensis TaxID=2878561 RepID=UPI001CD95DE3|nr:hypothetical protein [Jidongwangia harbinensis]MCA2219078.1 hypothetical protein [Jidongwangia harbinensis]
MTLAFQAGKALHKGNPAGVMAIEHAELLERIYMLTDRLEIHELELQNIRSTLEAAFGPAPPYSDDVKIIFDIGDRSVDDQVAEEHVTAAHHGNVVHWYAFEGFSRGRDQAFQFREVLVHLTRAREVGHERVTAVELTTAAAPRALITFTPPHERVLWEVRYRCPGYWDKLRQAGGQRFEWVPPPVGPGETKGRRSVVRAVTFVFRVPATLGTLEAFDLPRGASFRRAATDAHGSTYRIDIRDISALLGPPATAIDPIRWYLELKSADAP